MIGVLPKIPLYMAAKAWGVPKVLPLSYTLGVTYRCNSRCRTCNVYERKAKELDLAEYEKIFNSIGQGPVWFTRSPIKVIPSFFMAHHLRRPLQPSYIQTTLQFMVL